MVSNIATVLCMNISIRKPAKGLILSPRSGREHKAWGASPRITNQKTIRVREAGGSAYWNAVARFAGSINILRFVILRLAPQALLLRPLRGLGKYL
jgi:hypothetical protein